MVFKGIHNFIYKLVRAIAADEIPLLLRHFRGDNEVTKERIRVLAFLYRVCLYLGAHLLLAPARYRLICIGIYYLHVHDNCEKVLSKFKIAAIKCAFPIHGLILHLIQLEFLAATPSSDRNSLALLEFSDSISENSNIKYKLALNYLLQDRVKDAGKLLLEAINLNIGYAMSHQNMAARYNVSNWMPQPLDLMGDADCHLYDAYHLLGQQLVNNGDASRGLVMFGRAMRIQVQLAGKYAIPQKLVAKLAAMPGYDESKAIRIVPYEWLTQIGHMGMLDALIKMSRLRMRPDVNWVLLAPKDKIVNSEYLNCWSEYFVIVRDSVMVQELFPYQRICGEQFNCYFDSDGSVIDWSDAASRAFREWDSRQCSQLVVPTKAILGYGQKKLAALGVPNGAWFVTLHVRSGGFYAEGYGFIQKHRNAPLSSYISAVEEIVRAGGWVIRMGDSSMPKLPVMKNVIDIAHSPYKSEKLDVYLWSKCKFFISTTSGPTNVAISFHTPTLLVNCVSNYAQSWNSRVIFMLKPFWSVRHKRFLKYSEVFTSQYRASMFSGRSMKREGIYPVENSSEDILLATKEMLEFVNNKKGSRTPEFPELANSNVSMGLWGNGIPSQSYLKNHPELLN